MASRIVGSDITVADNRCINNAVSGVHVQSGTSNIIGRNQLLGNRDGLQIDSTLSLVYANLARGNSTSNYSVVAGNRIGLVVVPTTSSASGNTGGAAFQQRSLCKYRVLIAMGEGGARKNESSSVGSP